MQAGLRMTKMKADRTLRGEERREKWGFTSIWQTDGFAGGQRICDGALLWYVGCDEGSHRNKCESQDVAQGEVDEGGATQQHGQVQHSYQLQHFPALLCPLAWQQPSTNSNTSSSLSCITGLLKGNSGFLDTRPYFFIFFFKLSIKYIYIYSFKNEIKWKMPFTHINSHCLYIIIFMIPFCKKNHSTCLHTLEPTTFN